VLFSSSNKKRVSSHFLNSLANGFAEPEIRMWLGNPQKRLRTIRNSVIASEFRHLLAGMTENLERSAIGGWCVYPAQEKDAENHVCYDCECVLSDNTSKQLCVRQCVA
jgi:hypothetical protein